MNPRRDLPSLDRGLKSAFRDLVINRVGGVDAALATHGVRVGRSQLGSYLNPHEDAFARIDVVAALETAAGQPVVTTIMALRQGHVLVPTEARGEGDLAEGMAKLGRESGEAFGAFADGLADGRFDVDEIDEQIRKHQDLIRQAKSNIGILARMRGQVA